MFCLNKGKALKTLRHTADVKTWTLTLAQARVAAGNTKPAQLTWRHRMTVEAIAAAARLPPRTH